MTEQEDELLRVRGGPGQDEEDGDDGDSMRANPGGSQATSVSAMANSQPSSRNPSPGQRRPMTRYHLAHRVKLHQHQHQSQNQHDQASSLSMNSSITTAVKSDHHDEDNSSRFRGLTPPPMNYMAPGKKRAFEDIIQDTTVPEKDKLLRELDKLTRADDDGSNKNDKESDREYILVAGTSSSEPTAGWKHDDDDSGNNSQQRKKAKVGLEPSEETPDSASRGRA